MLNPLFTLEIFTFLSSFFDYVGHAGERLEDKAKVNSKIYDVRDCTTNNDNPHIVDQYLRK